MAQFDFDLIVIGSGFGGTMTALTIAHRMSPKALSDEQDKLATPLKNDPHANRASENPILLARSDDDPAVWNGPPT